MPWCTTCDRYLAPPSVEVDGTCPACRRPVQVVVQQRRRAAAPPPGDAELGPVPWHFKAFLAAFALYLGWRFAQLAAVLF
jgi:hypothetical protein